MTQQLPVVYDSVANTHKPMLATDTLFANTIPVSARTQNNLQVLADGLYVGTSLANTIYYVSTSTGVDATTSGTITTPYATIDYALAQILLTSTTSGFSGRAAIELKSNEAFTMHNDFIIDSGQLSIGFYGEPTYGSTSSYVTGTSARSWAVNSVLQRPTLLNSSVLVSNYWCCNKFVLRNSGRLIMRGLNIQLPNSPASISASSYGMYSDLIAVENHHRGTATIEGCIVNKNDVTSNYGLAGVQARTDGLTFSQFASQLQIGAVTVISGASSQTLLSRASFFKFYPDYSGINQVATSMVPASTTSSPGSGIMRINWSDVSVQTITGNIQNLGTYPLLVDTSYGLTNYFTGLTRDQQGRPQNIASGRLF